MLIILHDEYSTRFCDVLLWPPCWETNGLFGSEDTTIVKFSQSSGIGIPVVLSSYYSVPLRQKHAFEITLDANDLRVALGHQSARSTGEILNGGAIEIEE